MKITMLRTLMWVVGVARSAEMISTEAEADRCLAAVAAPAVAFAMPSHQSIIVVIICIILMMTGLPWVPVPFPVVAVEAMAVRSIEVALTSPSFRNETAKNS